MITLSQTKDIEILKTVLGHNSIWPNISTPTQSVSQLEEIINHSSDLFLKVDLNGINTIGIIILHTLPDYNPTSIIQIHVNLIDQYRKLHSKQAVIQALKFASVITKFVYIEIDDQFQNVIKFTKQFHPITLKKVNTTERFIVNLQPYKV